MKAIRIGLCVLFAFSVFAHGVVRFGRNRFSKWAAVLLVAWAVLVPGFRHSIVEFNLHIPSNALLFSAVAYLSTSAPLPSEGSSPRRRLRNARTLFAEDEVSAVADYLHKTKKRSTLRSTLQFLIF